MMSSASCCLQRAGMLAQTLTDAQHLPVSSATPSRCADEHYVNLLLPAVRGRAGAGADVVDHAEMGAS